MPKNRFEVTVTFVVDLDEHPDWKGEIMVGEFDAIANRRNINWFLFKEAEYRDGKRLVEWGYKKPPWVTQQTERP